MAIALAAALGGCVPAGHLDPGLLSRYEQLSVCRGPQERGGSLLCANLEGLVPVPGTTGAPLKTTKDPATGRTYVEVSLQEAVYRALQNNLDIKVTGYDTAVAWEDVVRAAAAFDWTVFGSFAYQKTDEPAGTIVSLNNQQRAYPFQVGVREQSPTGSQLQLAYSESKTTFGNPAVTTFNPQFNQNLAVKLTQPLLRNGWFDYNCAQLRVARVNYQITLSQFESKVLDTVTQVETLYWQLILARQNLRIQEDLLARTIQTYEQVRARRELDASSVQVTQARAAVETTRAALFQATENIFDVQDQLVKAMADASITLLGQCELIPTSPPSRVKLTIDRIDQIATSLRYNPELDQARRAIMANDINVQVAFNQTLPQLDLVAGSAINGLTDQFESSWEQMWDSRYLDYNLGVQFSYPIGNRQAEAALRKARLQRTQSVAALQNAADQVALNVNTAIRQIDTNYETMRAQQAAVEANRANLQAIEDRERFRAALTPEFLQLKLQAQQQLAASEQAELQATVNFNIAQANLARATGTSLQLVGVKVSDCGEDLTQLLSKHAKYPPPGPEAGTGLPPLSTPAATERNPAGRLPASTPAPEAVPPIAPSPVMP